MSASDSTTQSEHRHRRRGRLPALRAAATGLSLATAVLALEVGLRLFHPVALHPTDTFLLKATNEAQAGVMALKPGAIARTRSDEFDVEIRINSHGMRDREMPAAKPAGVYRVLVLGDSQTFGYGVEAGETYPKVLERRLRASVRRPIEVINAGVPGIGTAQELYFLETEGWKWRPDAVVVGAFLFNDVGDNGLSRLYAVVGGRLVAAARPGGEQIPLHRVAGWQPARGDFRVVRQLETPPAPAPSFWIRHSHLARWVRERVALALRRRQPEIEWGSQRHAIELTGRLLREIQRQCDARGVACVVALIPALAECRRATGGGLIEADARLLRSLERPTQTLLDLLPPFRAAGASSLYFARDLHMNPAGHLIAGDMLARKLLGADPRKRSGR